MTFDEWLVLSKVTNAVAAERMNGLRHILPPGLRVRTPPSTLDRVSRIRLGRKPVHPGEIALVEHLTGGAVQASDWQGPPAPPARPGQHRRPVYGVWIVFRDGEALPDTARLLQDDAWRAAGFRAPVDAVALKQQGIECRMVSKVQPTREMRRAAAASTP